MYSKNESTKPKRCTYIYMYSLDNKGLTVVNDES